MRNEGQKSKGSGPKREKIIIKELTDWDFSFY
jgi:hypothetical protein